MSPQHLRFEQHLLQFGFLPRPPFQSVSGRNSSERVCNYEIGFRERLLDAGHVVENFFGLLILGSLEMGIDKIVESVEFLERSRSRVKLRGILS